MTWRPIETYEALNLNNVLASDGDTVWVAWRDDDGQWFDATMGDSQRRVQEREGYGAPRRTTALGGAL